MFSMYVLFDMLKTHTPFVGANLLSVVNHND